MLTSLVSLQYLPGIIATLALVMINAIRRYVPIQQQSKEAFVFIDTGGERVAGTSYQGASGGPGDTCMHNCVTGRTGNLDCCMQSVLCNVSRELWVRWSPLSHASPVSMCEYMSSYTSLGSLEHLPRQGPLHVCRRTSCHVLSAELCAAGSLQGRAHGI